ncbi:MAG: aminoacyl-tRNA hydrolase [Nocardioidaceae bacterium]
MADEVWLVVGLGNPGPTYQRTRHNVGYLVADELSRRMGGSWRSHKSGRAEVVEGRLPHVPGTRVVLGRPRSYMNESGGPVAGLAAFYKVDPAHVVVVHDELDIEFDALRVKFGGGDNGHNGLRSVRSALGTGDFFRIRVGIGRPPGRQDPADFVLRPFAAGESTALPLLVDRAADSIASLLTDGLESTQSTYNGPGGYQIS